MARTHEQQRRLDRISAIATEIVGNMVEKGDVDPNDEAAMDRAIKQAVKDAAGVYDAAVEYVGG